MRDLFVSYRRADSADVVGRICDRLASEFGKDRLFKDVDSILYGLDFPTVIADAVGQCRILLAVIGDDWLDVRSPEGSRRIDDPNDFVHLEVAAALARNVPVIPVLVENASMPREVDLPEPLKALAFRHASRVRADPDFDSDMDRLCRHVKEHLGMTPSRRIWRVNSRTAVTVSVVCSLLFAISLTAVVLHSSGFFQHYQSDEQVSFTKPITADFESDTIVCQIFDTTTRERILKPFTLKFDNVVHESVGTQCEVRAGSIDGVDEVTVDGYLSRAPDEIERWEANGRSFAKCFVSRDYGNGNFMNSILPNYGSITRLPSDEEIALRMRNNSVDPKEVTFLVKNDTDHWVDVLLYYLPPSDHPDFGNPFQARTQLIPEVEARNWSHPFNSFRLQAGFFVIHVSHSGKIATFVTQDALYQGPWVVLSLSRVDDPAIGQLDFFESDPRIARRETQ